MKYPYHLLKLIDVLKKLPGVGQKSAERYAFELLSWPEERLHEMAQIIQTTKESLRHCMDCGCLIDVDDCPFCQKAETIDPLALCIVASSRDVFAIEATREFSGIYHVLGALLSPMQGIGPANLSLSKLKQRLSHHQIEEVVIALDSTLEGDATALYLKQELDSLEIKVSRLAFGLPLGSSLDYVDGGTLARALSARGHF